MLRGARAQHGIGIEVDQRESTRRGGWYDDPFEKADQRWWDGGRWTAAVRDAPRGETALSHATGALAGDQHRVEEAAKGLPPGGKPLDTAGFFPASIVAAVGQAITLTTVDPESATDWNAFAGSRGEVWGLGYELRAAGMRVGAMSFSEGELARLACRDGVWRLLKRRRLGWELLIQSVEGDDVGWYSGRHWRQGGKIVLADGTAVILRPSLNRRWRLETSRTGQRFAEITTRGRLRDLSMSITIRSLPLGAESLPPVILTASAVLILERMIPTPGPSGGPSMAPTSR